MPWHELDDSLDSNSMHYAVFVDSNSLCTMQFSLKLNPEFDVLSQLSWSCGLTNLKIYHIEYKKEHK
jgi:hypothetical protein